VDVPEDIAALPDITAFGNVHDPRQALIRVLVKIGGHHQ